MKEAREILNWATIHSHLSIPRKVLDYKYESYKAQFFAQENKFMRPIQISEERIKGSHPNESVIPDISSPEGGDFLRK